MFEEILKKLFNKECILHPVLYFNGSVYSTYILGQCSREIFALQIISDDEVFLNKIKGTSLTYTHRFLTKKEYKQLDEIYNIEKFIIIADYIFPYYKEFEVENIKFIRQRKIKNIL